jgi:hypothetical protein
MSDRPTAAHWHTDPNPAGFNARTDSAATASHLEASAVQNHLRACGVIVHHAARMPTPRDGRQVIVLFLDGTVGKDDLVRYAKRLPGVLDVVFSGYNRAVMYVIASPVPAHQQIGVHPAVGA